MITRIYLAAVLMSLAALNTRAQDPKLYNLGYPMDTNASLGATVSFRVYASTTNPPLTYRWQHEGTNLPAATNVTLVLSNLTIADAGGYMAWVSNASGGFTNSRTAILTVDTLFTKITTGPVVTDNEDSWGSVWVDYDLDGDVDLFVANGLIVGNQRNALYRNEGNGVFTRMTAATAGAIVDQPGAWGAAAWADYDNDGLPDAMVAGYRGMALYRNLGEGMFEHRSDLVPQTWPTGPAPCFADFDNDGWVDWFVCSAVSGLPVRTNSLYRNENGGGFIPVTAGPIVTDVLLSTYSAAWGDYDSDGDLDLVIMPGHYLQKIRLYENLGGGSFQRAQTEGLEDDLGAGAHPFGCAWGDCDNDGRLDLFVVSGGLTPNVLFHNVGNGTFTKQLMGKTGINCDPAWADYDNDGWLDLFLARGQGAALASQLWHNNGDGTFTEVTTGSLVTELARSQGAAWGDYDNDGFMDLFVARGYVNGWNALYHNNGNSNSWLKLKLEGITSNRSAIGAKVKVRATINGRTFWQMREIPGGNRCQDDIRANFGLGNAAIASTVRIEWPSAAVQELANVAVNQMLTVCEPPALCAAVHADCSCELTIKAETNRVWQVQASSDLLNWQTLATVTNVTYQFQYNDPDAANHTSRFYRVKGQ